MKKLRITVEGQTYEVIVEDSGFCGAPVAPAPAPVAVQKTAAPVPAPVAASAPAPKAAPLPAGKGDVTSPLSAVVVEVHTAVGSAVKTGDKLITLEAMKMNTFVNAVADGTVSVITVKAGDAVEEGQVLVRLG